MNVRRIDAEAAGRFLVGIYGANVEMEEPIAQGEWSRAFAFRLGDRHLIARFNPEREAFDLDVFAERFRSATIPIPAIVTVGEGPDGYFAVSERAFGDFLEELDAERFRAVRPALVRLLEALRSADTAGTNGFGPWDAATGDGRYPRWRDYLLDVEAEVPGRSVDSWRDKLRQSPLAADAFDRGMDALHELAPACPELRSVVHSDLLNRNVLVQGGAITAVIDWQCAMYGDHLYDLAWFGFWAPWHAGVSGAGLGALATEADARLRMRCYEVHIGVRHLIYNAWRRGVGADLDAVARRTLEVFRQS